MMLTDRLPDGVDPGLAGVAVVVRVAVLVAYARQLCATGTCHVSTIVSIHFLSLFGFIR